MSTIRLTAAQALVRFLAAQRSEAEGVPRRLFGGVWAIFGHGSRADQGCVSRGTSGLQSQAA
jgi:3D-(3,5/4)-trihydroxycyclohexane-1,2-dione acylhydrolase (decyclizing)